MNNTLKVIIIGILLGACFLVGRCSKECKTELIEVPVTIPKKEGEFKSPEILIPKDTNIKTVVQYKDSSVIIAGKINKELADNYIKLLEENDKLKAFKAYADAIKINTYETKFDNEDLSLTIKSKVEGKLLEIVPSYVRKEINTNVAVNVPKPPEKVFSMNIGAGLSTTKQLDKIEPTVHIDLINKRGNILSVGYGSEGTIQGKYSIPLFSIKK